MLSQRSLHRTVGVPFTGSEIDPLCTPFGYQLFGAQARGSVAEVHSVSRYLTRPRKWKNGAAFHPLLCSVCLVLCPVVPVVDEFGLTGFLLIQAFTERQPPFFDFVFVFR